MNEGNPMKCHPTDNKRYTRVLYPGGIAKFKEKPQSETIGVMIEGKTIWKKNGDKKEWPA